MRKLLYTFLAVSIIFAACKKEEENNNPPTSPASIVGTWTATNVVIDSTLIVSYMGETIDSLSSSGSRTLTPQILGTPTSLEFFSDGTVYVEFPDTSENGTDEYLINGNILIIVGEVSFHFTVDNSNLSLTGGEEDEDYYFLYLPNGQQIMVEEYSIYSNTLNFNRNTSGIVNNNISQRVGNTNHSWFVKPKFNNILKSIK